MKDSTEDINSPLPRTLRKHLGGWTSGSASDRHRGGRTAKFHEDDANFSIAVISERNCHAHHACILGMVTRIGDMFGKL
jgi:hypothetical protein